MGATAMKTVKQLIKEELARALLKATQKEPQLTSKEAKIRAKRKFV